MAFYQFIITTWQTSDLPDLYAELVYHHYNVRRKHPERPEELRKKIGIEINNVIEAMVVPLEKRRTWVMKWLKLCENIEEFAYEIGEEKGLKRSCLAFCLKRIKITDTETIDKYETIKVILCESELNLLLSGLAHKYGVNIKSLARILLKESEPNKRKVRRLLRLSRKNPPRLRSKKEALTTHVFESEAVLGSDSDSFTDSDSENEEITIAPARLEDKAMLSSITHMWLMSKLPELYAKLVYIHYKDPREHYEHLLKLNLDIDSEIDNVIDKMSTLLIEMIWTTWMKKWQQVCHVIKNFAYEIDWKEGLKESCLRFCFRRIVLDDLGAVDKRETMRRVLYDSQLSMPVHGIARGYGVDISEVATTLINGNWSDKRQIQRLRKHVLQGLSRIKKARHPKILCSQLVPLSTPLSDLLINHEKMSDTPIN